MTVLIFQHVACEGSGFFGEILTQEGIAHHLIQLHRGDSPFFPSPSALIILGGSMNVDEIGRYPFLGEERLVLAQAIQAGIPCLGICLGAQLIARVLGAEVRPHVVREIGYSEVMLTPQGARDPLLLGLGRRLTVFQWHGDTFDLPAGAVHLASSASCLHQAFRFGRSTYALQFHLEATPAMVELWAREYAQELASTPEAQPPHMMVAEARERGPELRAAARTLLRNFLALLPS